MIAQTTNVTLPTSLVDALTREATARGMSLVTYLEHLRLVQIKHIDYRIQDAARFMLTKHADSLRKLAQ